MNRRNLILLIGGGCVGGLTAGTGAFSNGAAEREMNVDVVPDDEALVGYEVREDVSADDSESGYPEIVVTASENEERTLATVTNRLGGHAVIKIADVEESTQDDEEPTVTNVEWDKEPFRSTADIRGSIVCSEAESDTIELTVTLEGVGETGVTATLSGDTDTRRFVARCEPKPEPDSVDTDQQPDEDAGTGNESGK